MVHFLINSLIYKLNYLENTIIPPEEYNDLNYWKIKIDTNVDFSKWL